MKIATWNVNSIRTRLAQVLNWLEENPVDVLCLQETKVVDANFPTSAFTALGYYVYASGQKSYNGVAILSRTPLIDVSQGFTPVLAEIAVDDLNPLVDEQKRVISGVLEPGIRIVNLYVPNGAAVASEKYAYKLYWLKILRAYVQTLLDQQSRALLICGDFNIALEDRDIHNPQSRENRIMASEPERQALRAVLELGLADAFRKFTVAGGYFSWWDYRAAALQRNWGWRIDHIYLTPILYEQAIACTIDCSPRKLPKPSDHAPVIVELST